MDKPIKKGRNVLGEPLGTCCTSPMTGFYRDGCCRTGPEDRGLHLVCAEMTTEFLEFSRSRGNDLMTPMPQYQFPGLKAGDRWCLCVLRWKEALEAGLAPKICLGGNPRLDPRIRRTRGPAGPRDTARLRRLLRQEL